MVQRQDIRSKSAPLTRGLFDRDRLLMGIELQDQLLNVVERFLVLSSLSDLNNALPIVLGFHALTFLANLIDHAELDHGRLLKQSAVDVLLDSELDFDALGVRLGPDEASVDEMHLVEAFDSLQANGQELTRLESSGDPRGRWLQVAFALVAKLQETLLGQVLGDVDLGLNALNTSV